MRAELPSMESFQQYPLVCWTCIIAIGLFVAQATFGWNPSIGYMAPEMYTGEWWRWFTPAFFHVSATHLFMNLFWIWMFGSLMERCWGSWPYAVLFVLSAVIANALQLVIDGPGIGMSGVTYALGGFIWLIPRVDTRFKLFHMPGLGQMLLGWIVIGVILSELNILPIGNVAHAAGGVTGLVFAAALPKSVAKKFPVAVPRPDHLIL